MGKGPVMDVLMSGCVPPVDVLWRLCVSAHKWLTRSPQRWLMVHGEEVNTVASSASVTVLSAYLFLAGMVPNTTEGIRVVCDTLGVPERTLFSSQRRYLDYFELLQRGVVQTVDASAVQLDRVVIVGVGGDQASRVLQIWQQDDVLFHTHFEASDSTDFIFQVGVHCQGDLSIRILRGSAEHKPVTITELELQVCFHTAFLSGGFARFSEGDIDALHGAATAGCTIDIFLQSVASDVSSENLRENSAAPVATAAAIAARGSDIAPEACRPATSVAAIGSNAASLAEARGIRPAGGSASSNVVFLPEDVDAFFNDI